MPYRVEDIKRGDHRSIRSVPLEKGHHPQKIRVTPPSRPVTRNDKRPRRRSNRRFWLVVIAVIVLIVVGTVCIASSYFSKATFSVVPVSIPVTVGDVTIVATATSTTGYLKYDIIKYSGVASTTLEAADGPLISAKSKGTVTLYNAYDAEGQRLIAGTRFMGDSGLVYRLSDSIFIPAYAKSSGSIVPGAIRAIVVADSPGAEYNLSKNDAATGLKIIAYKGGPRYDTVYAKLYTDISGGFTGTKKTVDKALLASTTKDLENALLKSLLIQAQKGAPSGYISYDNAYTMNFAEPVVSGGNEKTAGVSLQGTLYSVIFKESELVAKLAGRENVDRFGKSDFASIGLESLQFVITNPETFQPAKNTSLIARFKGNLELRGIVPTAELKHKLAGLSLAGTQAVFASYSSVIDVSKSSGELFPSWASSVPTNENRISLIIKDK